MKKLFYHLHYPSDRPHQVYGRPEWRRRFGTAEWSQNVGGLSIGRLLPPYGQARVDLAVILASPKIGDFVWTWYSDCIVTDTTLSLFRQEGYTGFEARPVTVERIKRLGRKRCEETIVAPLWELLIHGEGGDAAPESGIFPLYEIEESGSFQYSSFRNGIVVEEGNWDGSDFFTVNGYPKFILVTEPVKELIVTHQLTNCELIPSHKLEWGSGARPEESLERTRALASRDLESLLSDMDNPELAMETIHALGFKGDPRAVDPIIRNFDQPDPFIWNTAASAVAAIARNKDLPRQERDGIFSKLKDLLGHHDPLVRKSAATALGYSGGERAAEAVMRLFEDPNPVLRDTGVFLIGFLRYKPALETVRRLTRDPSKEVRATARRVLRELTAECP